ncbi:MAG: CAP domain-containing protein [Gaiellaceae bacterium]
MPRPPRVALAMLACAGILGAAAPAAEAASTRKEKRLVAKINHVRDAHGLRKVRISARLNRSAHRWAVHLRRSDSFYHARLASGTAENLAWGTCSWASPRALVRMWMHSPAHRAIMLDRSARRVGPGVSTGRFQGYRCVRMAVARFR